MSLLKWVQLNKNCANGENASDNDAMEYVQYGVENLWWVS